jgi:hypothetical protein
MVGWLDGSGVELMAETKGLMMSFSESACARDIHNIPG